MLLQLNAKNILQQLLSWRKDSSCSGLRQTKPSLEDSDSPFPAFQGIKILQVALKILVVGGVHPSDCTGEENYPNKPRCRELKPFWVHTAVSEKLRSGWVSLHQAALCRVSMSRPHPVPRPEPRGAQRGSSAWALPSGHQEPSTGRTWRTSGAKACKKREGTWARLPAPVMLASVFHHDGP